MTGRSARRSGARKSFRRAVLRETARLAKPISRRVVCESLESRTLLAVGDPIISEFMADNTTGLVDGNGQRGDWIEIYNPGASAVNLQGWHLTDNAANPNEYTFPSFNVPAGGYKVVFATSEAVPYIDSAGYPHTNFSLNKGGEYLALSKPDGTITTSFAPSFPPQTSNVSYGLGPGGASASTLLNTGAVGKSFTPTSSALGSTWTGSGFNDSSWGPVTTGIGFEANASNVPALTTEDETAPGNNTQADADDATTSFVAYSGNLYQLGINGTITASDTGDYFKIGTMQVGDILTLTASARGATPLTDPALELCRGANAATLVTSDDNSGPGNESLIHRFSITTADTYYVRVRPGTAVTGDYRLGIRLENTGTTPTTGSTATAESEANDTGATANEFSSAWRAVKYQSHITATFGASHDWFKYQFTAGDLVTVYVGVVAGQNVDSTIALRDSAGNALAYDDGTDAPPAPFDKDAFVYSYVIPTTGVYYVDTVRQSTTLSGSYAFDVYLSSAIAPPHPAVFAGQYATSVQSGMYTINTSNYLRVPFSVSDPANLSSLTLRMKYDDGFVAYLNGTEVARRNAPGAAGSAVAYNAAATADRAPAQASAFEDIDITAFKNLLVAGSGNLLAIQGLNSSINSDDFLIVPMITAQVASTGAKQYFYTPTPGAANIAGAGVVINEINYNPDVKTQLVDFLELVNNSTQNVNASGWKFSNGINYTFPANTTLTPGQYVVLAENAAQFQAKFGFAPFGQYIGSLGNDGDHVVLLDAVSNTVDEVTYTAGFPWPTVGDALTTPGTGASIQLINPGMDNDLGGNWRSALPTPGAQNSVYAGNAPPDIRQVNNSPDAIKSGQPVTITAKITDPDGVSTVNLLYQIVDPGNYIAYTDAAYQTNWTTVPMYDDGTHGDAKPGDGTYSAQIPASVQTNRRLVRYRVFASDTLGAGITVPYADDAQKNFAYFVYDGIPALTSSPHPGVSPNMTISAQTMNSVPAYFLISKQTDVENATWNSKYGGSDYLWTGTFVFNGKVYDNVGYRARGGVWRYAMGKNAWKINFNRNHRFQGVDNYGNPLPVLKDKLDIRPLIQQRDYWHRGEQGLFESVSLALFNLAGVPASNTNFFQFRIVDKAAEVDPTSQYKGDFWGLYLDVENYDGQSEKAHGLPDGNQFDMQAGTGAGGGALNNQGATQPSDNSDLASYTSYYINNAPDETWWQNNLNLPEYYSFRSIVEAVHDYDVDQSAGKNYIYYHNPVTNKWDIYPWDLDLTWADNMYGGGNEPYRDRVLPKPNLNIAYQNRLREIRDLLYNPEQTGQLIDEMAIKIYTPGQPSIVDADRNQWDWNPIMVNSSIVDLNKAQQGWYYQGNSIGNTGSIQVPPPGGFAGMIQQMKNYVVSRGAYLDSQLLTNTAQIPVKPTITYTGPGNHAVDALTFHSSNYSSPNASAFATMQWRVAEITDPNAPGYDPKAPKHYEIDANWQSVELGTFSADQSIPAGTLIPGHTYRVRVRMKDAAGRWSHWSDPVQFVAGAAASSLTSDLRITEIMYNPSPPPNGSTNIPDDFEYVELLNRGTSTLDLTGVKFTQGIDFTFPDGYTLAPGQRTLVVKNLAAFQSRYGNAFDSIIAGAYPTKTLSNSGDRIRLEGPIGQTILDFSYSDNWYPQTDGGGFSLVIVDPNAAASTWGDKNSWRASTNALGDPGADVPGLGNNAVVVNEILANPATPNQTWIELKNNTDAAIDISNWFLSNDDTDIKRYQFTSGTILPANGYLLLNEQSSYGIGTDPFTLSRLGGDLYLSQADAAGTLLGYSDHQSYDPSDQGVTVGRYIKSSGSQDFVALAGATPGAANALPKIGPIVIDEIMYNPGAGANEFVELHNITNGAVDMSGWTFDGISYTFPAGTIIGAHGYLLVVPIDPATYRSTYSVPAATQIFGPYAGLLDDAGDDLRLYKLGETAGSGFFPLIPVDRVNYDSAGPWPTSANGAGALVRKNQLAYGNDSLNWTASSLVNGTPGKPNFPATGVGSYDYSSAIPKFSVTFSEDVSATLTAGALTIQNLSGGPAPATTFSWDPATLTATWTFNQVPADANYRATLAAATVFDWGGNQFDGNGDSLPGGDYTQDFFYLAGDANHDRKVDFADLVVLAQNYNAAGGATMAQGDFTGDGNVDFSDLVVLAQRYNNTLPAAGAPVSAGGVDAAALAAAFIPAGAKQTVATALPPDQKKPLTKRHLPIPPPPATKPPVKKPTFSKSRIR